MGSSGVRSPRGAHHASSGMSMKRGTREGSSRQRTSIAISCQYEQVRAMFRTVELGSESSLKTRERTSGTRRAACIVLGVREGAHGAVGEGRWDDDRVYKGGCSVMCAR